jgi:protein SCO1/2
MATDTEPTVEANAPKPGPAFRRRDLLLAGALLVSVGLLAALLIHGPSKPKTLGVVPQQTAKYAGLEITPAKAEPALVLRNYLGDTVNVANYRGKAVLLTFLYTHCPDVCPLIASHLHTALSEMSAAERAKLQIIAVSVDPRGDTATTVAEFLKDHGMTGKMKYLIGSAPQLGRVWAAWGVGAERDAGNPALVSHNALIYGITGGGKIATIYPANLDPAQLVKDVPRLAAA